jgi:hypothetical protein
MDTQTTVSESPFGADVLGPRVRPPDDATVQDKLDYIMDVLDLVAGKITTFEANIGPAINAVTNGSIMGALFGRKANGK